MNKRESVSSDMLQALLDNELSEDDRAMVKAAIATDQNLAGEFLELKRLKGRLRSAYAHPPVAPPRRDLFRPVPWLGYGVAAAVGAFVAVVLVFGLRHAQQPTHIVPEQPLDRVVFHISTGGPAAGEALLDQVEWVLETYRKDGRPLRAQLVANNLGLNLYRSDLSQHAERIRELHNRYPNIVFAACGNTLKRLSKKERRRISLLPEVVVVDSGIAELTRRHKQGWIYIKA